MKPLPKAPDTDLVLRHCKRSLREIVALSAAEANRQDRYLFWDELRYKCCPEPLTPEEWWAGLKVHRLGGRHYLPFADGRGVPFSYTHNTLIQSMLDVLSTSRGGAVLSPRDGAVGVNAKFRYLVASGMEEAIMSSKLEGASTTRRMAKQMLRQKLEPKNHDDRMILNNYRTMELLLRLVDKPLTTEVILQIHRQMTEGTLEKPEMSGCFRSEQDAVVVAETISGDEVHIPPKAALLPARMQQLCDFVNGESQGYIHPILKAIILHFWIAHDHPFIDGNGRTARALFYWMMLRSGYDDFRYITISREICRHPKSYYQAFRYTEEDDADVTYFIADQLRTIRQALLRLHDYIRMKMEEQDSLMGSLEESHLLNIRQQRVLMHLMAHPDESVTADFLMSGCRVSKPTALADLAELEQLELLVRRKRGRAFVYSAAPELEDRIFVLKEEQRFDDKPLSTYR